MAPLHTSVQETAQEVDSRDSSILEKPQPKTSIHWRRYERVYRFFGFTKAYNFPLYLICVGAMTVFCLFKMSDFHYPTLYKQIGPGFNYYFGQGFRKTALLIHIATALPAAVLMFFQFTPALRHRFITFHRMNGYLILLLLAVTQPAGWILLTHNGTHMRAAAQSAEAFVGTSTAICVLLAWYNIRRLQIDQHRNWMLRAYGVFGTVVTSRVANEIASHIMTRMRGYYTLWSCDELAYVHREWGIDAIPRDQFPECYFPTSDKHTLVAVEALRDFSKPANLGSSFNGAYGALLWLTITVHIVGVEIYLNLTPAETQRLRKVSYERQLEAGIRKAGSAGLVATRLGDSEPYPRV